ncbi:MAG: FCD domain-containing protein [Pseudomonadota bacterium]
MTKKTDLSARIAKSISDAILAGDLLADDRLPSEAELAEEFAVSRSTVREALKRLAAQSLIRTERGAFGGAFVRQLSYDDARRQNITMSTLLLTMNEIRFDVACEARFALERACLPLSAARCGPEDLARLRREIARQDRPDLSDEAFCASDVAFHRAVVDSADNPILSYQLSGAVEAMQPLMNMITYTARSRARIVALHTDLADALERRDAAAADAILTTLQTYTLQLGEGLLAHRAQIRAERSAS